MEPPVPQQPASTATSKPNVPGAPPMPRPWYSSPWMFVALILLFLAAITFVTRELSPGATPTEGAAPVGDTTAAPPAR